MDFGQYAFLYIMSCPDPIFEYAIVVSKIVFKFG